MTCPIRYLIIPFSCPLDLHKFPVFYVAYLFWESPGIFILDALSVMLEYTYSWTPRRFKDLPGPLSSLVLRRLNNYGNRHHICVCSYFLHVGCPVYQLSLLLSSLCQREANLIVMTKVTANGQLQKALPLLSHLLLPSPQVSWPLQDAGVLGRKGSWGVNEKGKKAASRTFSYPHRRRNLATQSLGVPK